MGLALKVMVLAGGPDRERPVSLNSGREVALALREAGHHVIECDIGPDNLQALDRFAEERCDVLFPVLHGAWGEGGPLQRLLDQRGVPYVGCRTASAELCMDKAGTKAALTATGLPTPAWEIISVDDHGDLTAPLLAPPVVLKPIEEGSSIDVVICRSPAALNAALTDLQQRHRRLMVEQLVEGKELTVGVLAAGDLSTECPTTAHANVTSDSSTSPSPIALPPLQILPATEFYDYQAKYVRDDTQYLFEFGEDRSAMERLSEVAVAAFITLGCRHLARVDMFLDAQHQPWIIEVNTIPGFTRHSLLPKAAAHAGMPMAKLVDLLVRQAVAEGDAIPNE